MYLIGDWNPRLVEVALSIPWMVFRMHNLNKKTNFPVMPGFIHQRYQSVPISIIWKGRYMKFPNCCGIVTEGIQDEQFQDKSHQIQIFSRIKSVHSSLHCWTIVSLENPGVLLDLYEACFISHQPGAVGLSAVGTPELPQGIATQLYGRVPGWWVPYRTDGWICADVAYPFTPVLPKLVEWCSWWDV